MKQNANINKIKIDNIINKIIIELTISFLTSDWIDRCYR